MIVGLRKKSLLVVEDNVHMQKSMREMGVDAGFDATAEGSRDDAFEAIRRQRFDAAFVDMCLFEGDHNNRDGMEVLGRLADLGEGTFLVFFSGYGEFSDAVKAREYGAELLEKGTPTFNTRAKKFLDVAMGARYPRKLVTARAWCGSNDSAFWSTQANAILHPKGDYSVTDGLLGELLLTCDPILERVADNGLQKAADQSALTGLFWSRGLGNPVVVVVAHEEIPAPVPRLPQWPEALEIGKQLYRGERKNLVGAIFGCTGVEPQDFQVTRSYLS